MTLRGARDLSLPILLALVGAALCAGSLLLRWVELDLAVIERWVQTTPMLEEARSQTAMSPDQLQYVVQAGMQLAMKEIGDELTGYKLLAVPSVAAQVISAVVVVGAVARFMNQGTTRKRLAVELAAAGAVLMFRPVRAMTSVPDGGASVLFGEEVVRPGAGITVAIVGAALVFASALLAYLSASSGADAAERLEQEHALAAARTGGQPAMPGAFVPGLPARASTATAYVPTSAHVPAPAGMPMATPQQPAYRAPQQPAGGSIPPPGFG